MYMLEDMIEMGLKKGQKWPTDMHRVVACNLALCNPHVTTRDALTEIVQKVRKIPKSEIETVTMDGLRKYGLMLACVG